MLTMKNDLFHQIVYTFSYVCACGVRRRRDTVGVDFLFFFEYFPWYFHERGWMFFLLYILHFILFILHVHTCTVYIYLKQRLCTICREWDRKEWENRLLEGQTTRYFHWGRSGIQKKNRHSVMLIAKRQCALDCVVCSYIHVFLLTIFLRNLLLNFCFYIMMKAFDPDN